MRPVLYTVILSALLISGAPGWAQDVRLANGVIIKGSATKATDGGLEVQTPAGLRTYTWESLSVGTRYRHQPVFRANFDTVLQGLPASARTKPPDSREESPAAAESATAEAAAAPGKEDPAAKAGSMNLFDNLSYENIDPLQSGRIPNLQLRVASLAVYMGFQYGPGKDEVVYLAFDTKSAQDSRDVMFVYSPGAPEFKTPSKVAGFKKTAGDVRMVSFKKFKLKTNVGSITADYEMDSSMLGTATNALAMTISASLSKGDTKSRFLLYGQEFDLVQGDAIVNVKGILDMPVLWVSLDLTGGAPQLVGNLNMSNMKLVPKEGMDTRVALTIKDANGEVVQRDSVKLDEAGFTAKYGIVSQLKKATPGQTYTVEATINLGPFLGPVSFEEKFSIPATPGS